MHASGDTNEDNAISVSLRYFQSHVQELLVFHNCLEVFGIILEESYQERITKLEEIFLGMSITSARQEAVAILGGQQRYLYYGYDYVAVSSARKDGALIMDAEKARSFAQPGAIAVGFGDSGGDLPFLTARPGNFSAYLPFYVGKNLPAQARQQGVSHTKVEGIEGTKQILALIQRAHRIMSNREFYTELNKLIRERDGGISWRRKR